MKAQIPQLLLDFEGKDVVVCNKTYSLQIMGRLYINRDGNQPVFRVQINRDNMAIAAATFFVHSCYRLALSENTLVITLKDAND